MLGTWAVLALWTPPEDAAYTLCLFRRLTHLPCPTCGMTHALALLAKGDWRGSLARHPLGLPFAAELVLLWLLAALALRRGYRPSAARVRMLVFANAAVFLGAWVARLQALK